MYVNDPEKARDFFVKYLGGNSNDGYHNVNTGFRSYFISFEDGPKLEIMNKPGIRDVPGKEDRTGYVHIAFSVGSARKVDRLTEEFRKEGLAIYQLVVDIYIFPKQLCSGLLMALA